MCAPYFEKKERGGERDTRFSPPPSKKVKFSQEKCHQKTRQDGRTSVNGVQVLMTMKTTTITGGAELSLTSVKEKKSSLSVS